MHRQLYVIIAAGGSSTRMNGIDKTVADIDGRPLITHTVEPFLKHIRADMIIIAAHRRNKTALKKLFPQKTYPNVHVIDGGKNRFSSVQNGFKYIQNSLRAKSNAIIVIHNAANPLATSQEIRKVIREAARTGAAIAASSIIGTLKSIDMHAGATVGAIIKTIDRGAVWEAQTPQAFQYDILADSYAHHEKSFARTSHAPITDEAMLVENAGFPVRIIAASEWNKKITTQYDLAAARSHATGIAGGSIYGIGTDVHWFAKRQSRRASHRQSPRAPNKTLQLCGVAVSGYPHLLGNSDGDAALHAIATALSQALGKGSLGTFADKLCARGITDSARYFAPLLRELSRTHRKITHIGLHVECAKPRIDPLVETFKTSLANIAKLPRTHIGITATSGETTTPAGQGKAINCTAIISISPARITQKT